MKVEPCKCGKRNFQRHVGAERICLKMGQKVNPHGLRVGIIKDWDSRWYSGKADFGDILVEDYKIREYFFNKTYKSDKSPVPMKPGISSVEIERDAATKKVKIFIHTAKPGILIGSKGAEIEKMRKDIEVITKGKPVNLNILEIKDLDLNARLVAENIASQLEQRVSFRRAMKAVIGRTMKAGAMGIKTMVAGRLGGAEIARSENYHEGTIPLQTLRADIDYGTARANTTYGVIGVKVWIYKGEVLKGEIGANKTRNIVEKGQRRRDGGRDSRGERREGRGRPGGFNRDGGGNYGGNRDGGRGGFGGGNRGGYGGNRDNRPTAQVNRPVRQPTQQANSAPKKEGGNE